jgi:uncharacterized damage-inducible protein DinB
MKKEQSMPSPHPASGELSLLLRIIDESYEKKAWHGPNLKGSVRGLSADQAGWRPHSLKHSIAEIVVHCAYWKYAVRRRLTGEKRGSFSLKGSNWFAIEAPLAEAQWQEYVALLNREHHALRETVASFPPRRLEEYPKGGKVRFISQIYGIAMHDVYHAGQIQLIKRLEGLPG